MATVRIGSWFQGPTGSGQGGWTARQLCRHADIPTTVRLRAPIPLDVDLSVRQVGGAWHLFDPADPDRPIMEAEAWSERFPTTEPVDVATARRARERFPYGPTDHPVPHCFSCGIDPSHMHVHAGPLGDGRVAADWAVPGWAVSDDGSVDDGVLWAAVDCTAAWFVNADAPGTAFTVQFAARVLEPLEPGTTYALVGWDGDGTGWDGRKRHAASAAFDAAGRIVAQSVSMWVSTT